MSAIVARPRDLGVALPLARWGFLAALLFAEYLVLNLCFDCLPLARIDRWWAMLPFQISRNFPVAVAAAGATALFRGSRIWNELVAYDEVLGRARHWWVFLLGHLAAFASFAAITEVILGVEPGSPIRWPGEGLAGAEPVSEPGWFIAWALAGLMTMAFWCAAVLPPRSWVYLAKVGSGAISIGIVVGSLAAMTGRLTKLLWVPLSLGTFSTVEWLLRLAGLDVISRPDDFVIGTSQFRVVIGPACSGYEGIGLIWVFLGAYLWFYRRELRFPRALLLFPIGTVVIWLANSVRIAALVIVGSYGSREVARDGFHSHAGWLAFNAVALGLVIGSHRSRFFRTDLAPRPVKTEPNLAAAYLGPMLALLAAMMVTGAFSAGFDRFYPLRVLASALVLLLYRNRYTDLRATWSWEAVAIGAVVFSFWMALEPAPTATSPLKDWLVAVPGGWAAAWLAFRVVGSIVVVPLAEELAFRGFLVRRLQSADFTDTTPGRFTWGSFVISSVLFGALHGRFLAGALAGMLFAVALYRRREVSDAVVAHATTNALIAAYVLATGSWSMWT